MRFLLLILTLYGCSHDKSSSDKGDDPPVFTYAEASQRFLSMSDGGWAVSRWPDQTMADQGDSLLFTGLAMGVLSCGDGAAPESALLTMLRETGGVPYRHPTIKNEYSLDGLLGLWWGIDKRTRKCPETRERWAEVLPAHEAAITIEPYFQVALQQLESNLGVAEAPSAAARGNLGSEIGLWAIATVSQRQAAYRVHLGFLALDIVDAPHGKNVFCEAVKDAEIALVEQFCGRPGLAAWVSGFAYNRWVYQFQRGAWESPDGRPSLETPALDLLMALRMLYP